MKNKIYILLVLAFLILSCKINEGQKYRLGGYHFKYISDHSVSFCGWDDEIVEKLKGDMFVPEKIYDLDVVEIGEIEEVIGGWNDNDKCIKRIIIFDTVKRIEPHAFVKQRYLKKVTLPNSLKTISIGAFSRCENLKTADLAEGIKNIDDGAFAFCSSLHYISFPTTLESIGENAFWECESLTYATIPAHLKFIGSGAFGKCKNLNSVKFQDPSNWYVKAKDDSSWQPIDVSNPVRNAEILRTRVDYTWKKVS